MKSGFALVFFGLAAYAAFVAFGEFRVSQLALNDEIGRYEILVDAPPPRAHSVNADEAMALACDDTLHGEAAAFQPPEALTDIALHCVEIARGALAAAPTSTLAQYQLASAAAILGDGETANAALAASQATGRYESWLAKRRFKLALEMQSGLDGTGQAAFDADIAALLQSPKGITFLGKYYALQPGVRDQVLARADAAQDDTKRALLNAISRSMKRYGDSP